ncbi:MAG: hypothetical protein LBE62_10980 [Azonexus sp.]|jgi:Fic family protein|nr:hypothetical protein [Azonexus sp.]
MKLETFKAVLDAAELENALKITAPTANKLIKSLIEKKIIVEITGQQRGRIYAFDRYLNLFVS